VRRYLRILIIFVIPVAILRTADLLFFIDRETGFVKEGSIYIRVAGCLFVLFLGLLTKVVRKRSLDSVGNDIESTNGSMERSSFAAGLSFIIAGFTTAVSSVGTLFAVFSSEEGFLLKKSSEELMHMGISKFYYIVFFASAIFGVYVAFWMMIVGSWHFRGEGYFSLGRFGSVFVVFWYYLRIMKDFLKFPVNPNNTTSIAILISVLALAVFYTKLAKSISVDFPLSDEPSLFSTGAVAFLLVVGIGTPTVVVFAGNEMIDNILAICADFFAAVAALCTIYARLPAKEKKES